MSELKAHRELADRFVAMLTPGDGRKSTLHQVSWVKVVAERSTPGHEHVWIRQVEVLAALRAAGFQIRELEGEHWVSLKGFRFDAHARLIHPKKRRAA